MSVTRSIRVIAARAPIWPPQLGRNRLADVPYIHPCTDAAQCPVGPVTVHTGAGQIVAGVYAVAVGGNIGSSVTVLPGYGTFRAS
ncbi:hypothetical protein [Nocardia sp. NPDC058497]|uniref:hypothetical protein n=1 Tax=Nocardia sp. NPDC058497 TaxID=3346529 RepID=UPI003660C39F